MNKPIIKKHKNKNNYLLTKEGLWVRDFTRPMLPIDINNLSTPNDTPIVASNELYVHTSNIVEIGKENLPIRKKWIIISDGYHFKEHHQNIINQLPPDVSILAINRSLAKWNAKKKITYFVVNNPYNTCTSFINKEYYPPCILSSKTNQEFVKKYKGNKWYYTSANEERISSGKSDYWQVDDYRNPICASLVLAYQFGAEKILLLFCDDSFDKERAGSEPLENGLFQYPQHRIPHSLVDGQAYWLKKDEREIQVYDCSAGMKYENIDYIPLTNVNEIFI